MGGGPTGRGVAAGGVCGPSLYEVSVVGGTGVYCVPEEPCSGTALSFRSSACPAVQAVNVNRGAPLTYGSCCTVVSMGPASVVGCVSLQFTKNTTCLQGSGTGNPGLTPVPGPAPSSPPTSGSPGPTPSDSTTPNNDGSASIPDQAGRDMSSKNNTHTPVKSKTPPKQSSSASSSLRRVGTTLLIVGLGGVALLLLVAAVVLAHRKRRRSQQPPTTLEAAEGGMAAAGLASMASSSMTPGSITPRATVPLL